MKNEKKVFSAAEIEVILVGQADVIATSGAPSLMAYLLFSADDALEVGGDSEENRFK